MRLVLDALPSNAALRLASRLLEQDAWISGSTTAGRFAEDRKQNHQLDPSSQLYGSIKRSIVSLLLRSREIQYAAQPEHIHTIIVSRFSRGDHYGVHMDAPFMSGYRSDISFTLSLSDPRSYGGGELVIQDQTRKDVYRLSAGQLVLYPSTSLHYVEEVKHGERLAVVGWITSRIRHSHRRELLYELAAARDEVQKEMGDIRAVRLLNRCYGNLLREWST